MTLGSSKAAPWVLDEEDSLKILKAAYDCGINTWDSSSHYSNGLSEAMIGKAIHKFNIPRQKLVIMTKIGLYVGEELDVIAPLYGDALIQTKDYINQGGAYNLVSKDQHLYSQASLTKTQDCLVMPCSPASTTLSLAWAPHTSTSSRSSAGTRPSHQKRQ